MDATKFYSIVTEGVYKLLIIEGRARMAFHKYTTGTTAWQWEYAFYEKDHLCNTRVAFTQRKDTAKSLASMEALYRNT